MNGPTSVDSGIFIVFGMFFVIALIPFLFPVAIILGLMYLVHGPGE